MTATLERYASLTSGSAAMFKRASQVVPAGATRSLNSWPPHPVYLAEGAGAHVTDIDNRRYLDLLNNYTALVLGHANAAVIDAICSTVRRGSSFSYSTELEAELAETICARVGSLEMVRFTGSGTEANMFAIRIARAATGRGLLAKVEGGYHGTVDDVMVSVRPSPEAAGPAHEPVPLPDMAGLSSGLGDRTVVLAFNDVAASEAILDAHARDIAAVIVEPVLGVGGMIPATPEYLALLRRWCTANSAVLIFDEVITLRLDVGGAQALYGVVPDLTVTGKTIGGGMPIGAYGGRADLMELLVPRGGTDVYNARRGGPPLYQGGTFTGGPASLAAGLATLKQYDAKVCGALNAAGDTVRERLNAGAARRGLPLSVTGMGSLLNLHVTRTAVTAYRDTWTVAADLQHALFLELINRGYSIAPRGMACLSVPMTAEDRESFVDAALDAMQEVSGERQS